MKTLCGYVTCRSLDLMLFVPNLHLQSSRICFGAIKTVFYVLVLIMQDENKSSVLSYPSLDLVPAVLKMASTRKGRICPIVLDGNSLRNQYLKSSSILRDIQKIVKHNYS